MVSANRSKSADKQEVCRKVTLLLKKTYGATVPKPELPVLETLLYAICLENSVPENADKVYARLLNTFHDLNEVRVSSIAELAPVFSEQSDPEWRAARTKAVLQHVFETNYAFEFESLRRKTAELAAKQLAKIPQISAFVRSYVMQHCLGSHVLPIDDKMHAVLAWLGLTEREQLPELTSEQLRSHIRKADAPLFCHLLGCVANDPKRSRAFAGGNKGDDDAPLHRLEHLLERGEIKASKPKTQKAADSAVRREGKSKSRSASSSSNSKKRH
jgi:endonuclease-3